MSQPRDKRGVHCRTEDGVFANRAGIDATEAGDKQVEPERAIPVALVLQANPETSSALTVIPEVVYSPITLPTLTNRSDPEAAISDA